jgi:ankyrin repeat protein
MFENLKITVIVLIVILLISLVVLCRAQLFTASCQDLLNAVLNNNKAKVKALLKKGIDVNCTGGDGDTALDFAFANKYKEIVKILKKASKNQKR